MGGHCGSFGSCSTYLVRQSQGQLDLVGDSLGVATALDGSAEGRGTGPQSGTSKAEGVHGDGGLGGCECCSDPSLTAGVAKVDIGTPVVP